MYEVNCKGTAFHPNFFVQLIENGIKLNKDATQKAQTLFMLAGVLPQIPAGVLLDVVEGKKKYKIQGEKFIIE